jgi:hypothetical protein
MPGAGALGGTPGSSGMTSVSAGGAGAGTAGATAGSDSAGGTSGAGAGSGGAPAAGAAGTVGASGNAGASGSAGSAGAATGGAGARDLSTDKTLFLGASRCAQANVQLCEDFESGTLDAATWTVVGGAKPVIDGLQKARGSMALHLTISGGGQSAIRESKTFPAANNTYYGRVFAYFASLPNSAGGLGYSHWTMIAASGSGVTGEIRVSGQLQGGTNLWGVGTDSSGSANGTGDWTNSDKDPNGKPMAVPTGQWLCIEWLHKGDTNETRFWWDGVEHPSLYTKPTTPHGGNSGVQYLLPQFKQVWLGWQEYQATSEKFELWIDEIAIDKDRIGCVI